MADFEGFGWNGCWKCEHCLAVCPAGAVSIFGHRPEDSLPPVKAVDAAPVLDALIANRHSCRRYQDRDVDPGVIRDMVGRLANAPNGGNKQQVEFTLIDDRKQMERLRTLAFREMEVLAKEGVYPEGFDRASYEDMKRWRKTSHPTRPSWRGGAGAGRAGGGNLFRAALRLPGTGSRDADLSPGSPETDAPDHGHAGDARGPLYGNVHRIWLS